MLLDLVSFLLSFLQANVVLKEKETFIEYLQKQLNESKSKLDSEVCEIFVPIFQITLGIMQYSRISCKQTPLRRKKGPITGADRLQECENTDFI